MSELESYLQVENYQSLLDERVLFAPLSFKCLPSTLVQITGANGSGKTTLLQSLLNNGRSTGIKVRSKNLNISYLGHKNPLYEQMTVQEHFQNCMTYKLPQNIDVRAVCKKFQLSRYSQVANLSRGQCRRLALALVVCSQAKLWILDEPYSNLDIAGQKLLLTCIEQHLQAAGSVLLTSHTKVQLAANYTQILIALQAACEDSEP